MNIFKRLSIFPKPLIQLADNSSTAASILAFSGSAHPYCGGFEELGLNSLGTLLTVRYGSPNDAKARLGELAVIKGAFVGMLADLYRD